MGTVSVAYPLGFSNSDLVRRYHFGSLFHFKERLLEEAIRYSRHCYSQGQLQHHLERERNPYMHDDHVGQFMEDVESIGNLAEIPGRDGDGPASVWELCLDLLRCRESDQGHHSR
jgi:hypothetical protein